MTRRSPGLVVSLLFGLLVVLARPADGHAQTDEADEPTTVVPTLIDQTDFVEPDGRFVLRIDASDVPEDARVEVVVRDRVLSRSEFEKSVAGEQLRSVRFRIDPRPLAEVSGFADDAPAFEIQLGSAAGQAPLSREGAYPVEVRLFNATGARIGGLITHLIVLPERFEEPRPIAVAYVVDLGLPPALAPDGSRQTPSRAYGGLARIAEVVAEYPDVPLSIAARPETVDALSRADDADALAALIALREAVPGRQLMAAPFVDLDLAAMIGAGLTDEVDRHLERGARTLSDELGVEPQGLVWLAGSTLDPPAVDALTQRGRTAVVVEEGRVSPVDVPGSLSLTRTFSLSVPGPSPSVAKADPVLGFRLLDTVDPVLAAHTVLAELSVLSLEEPIASRGVVIRPPAPPPLAALEVVLAALSEPNNLVRPVTLDQFFEQVDALDETEVDLTPEPSLDLGGFAAELRSTRSLLDSYATMTGQLSSRSVPFTSLLLSASDRNLDDDDRSQYVETARSAVTRDVEAVSISEARTITLTARAGSVPLTLRNDSGVPLNIVLTLDSERLEFPNGGRLALTLTDEITRVDVAVRTRTSGSFPLRIQATSPDGVIELASTSVTIRSTAVSGVGIFLSIGALAILVLWWLRDWRSGRRDSRLVERSNDERDRSARAANR